MTPRCQLSQTGAKAARARRCPLDSQVVPSVHPMYRASLGGRRNSEPGTRPRRRPEGQSGDLSWKTPVSFRFGQPKSRSRRVQGGWPSQCRIRCRGEVGFGLLSPRAAEQDSATGGSSPPVPGTLALSWSYYVVSTVVVSACASTTAHGMC